jgi:S1-C subfamily serine protease
MAGLKRGDTVERVNGKPYTDLYNFFVRLADEGILTGETIELIVVDSSNESRRVRVRLY